MAPRAHWDQKLTYSMIKASLKLEAQGRFWEKADGSFYPLLSKGRECPHRENPSVWFLWQKLFLWITWFYHLLILVVSHLSLVWGGNGLIPRCLGLTSAAGLFHLQINKVGFEFSCLFIEMPDCEPPWETVSFSVCPKINLWAFRSKRHIGGGYLRSWLCVPVGLVSRPMSSEIRKQGRGNRGLCQSCP